ncbi:HEAT repeat domain-containing protein [Actinokineospora xionganensis]|uniref:HEAT repeat protein n=1 Tax=Actinokineospora xionganensis TaxID=2684470 RepID=A0ABR7LGE1_9PSEU|nr:hypothetical protein [Actinokineospora xionganensis]MBC6451734.1 hypothetical protein [Actinokineospora xionganensis]
MYRLPFTVSFGICRLRAAKPIAHYMRDLDKWYAEWRYSAVVALGDTADPEALAPIVRGLRDRHWKVRAASLEAMRRLSRDIAVERVRETDDCEHLVALLRDRKIEVARLAADTLGDLGMTDPVEAALRTASDADRIASFESVLRGEISPLGETWVGDNRI